MTSLNSLSRAVAALTFASGLCGVAAAQGAPASAPAQAVAPSPEALEIQRLIKSGQSTQALKLIDDGAFSTMLEASWGAPLGENALAARIEQRKAEFELPFRDRAGPKK